MRFQNLLLLSPLLLGACNPLMNGEDKSKMDSNFSPGHSPDDSSGSDADSSEDIPQLSYATSAGTSVTVGTAMSVTPNTLSGGSAATVTNCAITAGGSLPTGVSINSTTCVISGTPTTRLVSNTFTITVTNSLALTSTADVTLTVTEDWSDSDNSATLGFASGTHTGSSWDSANSYVRLTQSGTPTNNSELDSSWTPQYASIVGYWKLNGTVGNISTGDTVVATVGTNGVAKNSNAAGLAYLDGKLKQGIVFDATDDYIEGPSGGAYDVTAAVSLAAWFKRGATQGVTQDIFAKGTSFGPFRLTIGTTNLVALLQSQDGLAWTTSVAAASAITDTSTWHHVVATNDGTTAKLYIDGILSNSDTTPASSVVTTAIPVTIGASLSGALSPSLFFSGSIDEVALWSGVTLTADEIQTIYSRQSAKYAGTYQSRVFDAQAGNAWDGFEWLTTLPFGKELTGDANNSGTITASDSETSTDYSAISTDTLMSGIVGLWHLNEPTGTTGAGSVTDSSGSGHHGTPGGTLTFGESTRFSKGTSFSAGHVNAGSANELDDLSSFSLSAWIYPRTVGNFGLIAGKFQTGNCANGWCFCMDSVNQVTLKVEHATGHLIKTTLNNSITYKNWYHVAVTWDGSSSASGAHIFLNGIESSYQASTDGTGARLTDAVRNLTFGGRDDSGQAFDGIIDEVAIWNRVLDSTEIHQLYRRGANRIKYQVRACTASNCSDNPTWLGANGSNTPLTYFSELQNNTAFSTIGNPTGRVIVDFPELLFSWFSNLTVPNNRYFQYRAILESDDTGTECDYGSGATWCSPELQSVTIAP